MRWKCKFVRSWRGVWGHRKPDSERSLDVAVILAGVRNHTVYSQDALF